MHNLIPSMSDEAIGKVRRLEVRNVERKQVDIPTDHVLHGGMYARTIMIPAEVLLTGALIKIATMLIVAGNATVYMDGEAIELNGYNIFPACKNRKQAFYAHADTYLTMLFPTQANTVEEAEIEFTDEHALLFSRKSHAINNVTITGK